MSSQLLTKIFVLTLALLFGSLPLQGLHPILAQAEQRSNPTNGVRSAPSADDYAIAYVGPSRNSQQIRLVNPDGSADRLVWEVPADTLRADAIGELSWRSDASELAFDSGHDWQRSMHLRDIYAIGVSDIFAIYFVMSPGLPGCLMAPGSSFPGMKNGSRTTVSSISA
jgi:hypothetical protein